MRWLYSILFVEFALWVASCQLCAIAVSIVGIPSPFGRRRRRYAPNNLRRTTTAFGRCVLLRGGSSSSTDINSNIAATVDEVVDDPESLSSNSTTTTATVQNVASGSLPSDSMTTAKPLPVLPKHNSATIAENLESLRRRIREDITSKHLNHANVVDLHRIDDALYTSANVSVPILRTKMKSWKEALPGRLRLKGSKTIQKICLGNVDIYLLGTAHVSNDSSVDVQMLLDHVQPTCIFVELCEARVPLLEGSTTTASMRSTDTIVSNNHNNTTTEISTNQQQRDRRSSTKQSLWERIQSTHQAQGGNSRWQALSTVLLSSVQEDYAEEMGVELGGEFRCAYNYWINKVSSQPSDRTVNDNVVIHKPRQQVHMILGDRPVQLTLIRAWESLTWWPKVKVIVGLIWSSIFRPNKEEIRKWLESVMKEESDVLTQSFAELRKHFPTLYTTIITERDAWLAAKLVQTCRAMELSLSPQQQPFSSSFSDPQPPQRQRRLSIVAIVGAGHIPGICTWLTTKNLEPGTTPESVLSNLVATRRWANDDVVQTVAIPMWIHEVSELPPPPPPA